MGQSGPLRDSKSGSNQTSIQPMECTPNVTTIPTTSPKKYSARSPVKKNPSKSSEETNRPFSNPSPAKRTKFMSQEEASLKSPKALKTSTSHSCSQRDNAGNLGQDEVLSKGKFRQPSPVKKIEKPPAKPKSG